MALKSMLGGIVIDVSDADVRGLSLENLDCVGFASDRRHCGERSLVSENPVGKGKIKI
jgi:hypothetical protein|tara:strand:- start:710 stop:883 length:174 start_codon:yes stop_codon:yes gene_type:complete